MRASCRAVNSYVRSCDLARTRFATTRQGPREPNKRARSAGKFINVARLSSQRKSRGNLGRGGKHSRYVDRRACNKSPPRVPRSSALESENSETSLALKSIGTLANCAGNLNTESPTNSRYVNDHFRIRIPVHPLREFPQDFPAISSECSQTSDLSNQSEGAEISTEFLTFASRSIVFCCEFLYRVPPSSSGDTLPESPWLYLYAWVAMWTLLTFFRRAPASALPL